MGYCIVQTPRNHGRWVLIVPPTQDAPGKQSIHMLADLVGNQFGQVGSFCLVSVKFDNHPGWVASGSFHIKTFQI